MVGNAFTWVLRHLHGPAARTLSIRLTMVQSPARTGRSSQKWALPARITARLAAVAEPASPFSPPAQPRPPVSSAVVRAELALSFHSERWSLNWPAIRTSVMLLTQLTALPP
jgi:hypothetical protein